jgi:hypothetical protein
MTASLIVAAVILIVARTGALLTEVEGMPNSPLFTYAMLR